MVGQWVDQLPIATRPLWVLGETIFFQGRSWIPYLGMWNRKDAGSSAPGLNVQAPRTKDLPLEYWERGGHPKSYCWWLKSCTTWDAKNPVNNGIYYLSTGAGVHPSTVPKLKSCVFNSGKRRQHVSIPSWNISKKSLLGNSNNLKHQIGCLIVNPNRSCPVDGRDPAPVEVGSLSHYLPDLTHPSWGRISSWEA